MQKRTEKVVLGAKKSGRLKVLIEYGMQTSQDEDSDTWNPEDDQSEEEEAERYF